MKGLIAFIILLMVFLAIGYSYGAEKFLSPIRELKPIQTNEAALVTDVRTYKVSNFLDGVFIERCLKDSMRAWGVQNPERIRYRFLVNQTDRTEFIVQYLLIK